MNEEELVLEDFIYFDNKLITHFWPRSKFEVDGIFYDHSKAHNKAPIFSLKED